MVAAGLLAGGVLAGAGTALAAGASGTATTPGTTSGSAAAQPGAAPQGGNSHSATSVRTDEKQLTGTDAEKAKAAALKAVPGGTVYRVETDAGDGKYEAHLTKADGTEVTVKLDQNFAVIATEDGMGKGDPAPAGRQGQAGQQAPGGAAPSAAAPSA